VSKPESYYDWELKFRVKPKGKRKRTQNELGIDRTQFEAFIKKWKAKNLDK